MNKNAEAFVTEGDVIIYGYNTVVHDFPSFLGNYMHVQTVDTRPLFFVGVWPGNEASLRLTIDCVQKRLAVPKEPHCTPHPHKPSSRARDTSCSFLSRSLILFFHFSCIFFATWISPSTFRSRSSTSLLRTLVMLPLSSCCRLALSYTGSRQTTHPSTLTRAGEGERLQPVEGLWTHTVSLWQTSTSSKCPPPGLLDPSV